MIAGLGGFMGTCLRYLTGRLCHLWELGGFPLGTFVVNIVGSFIIGALLGYLLGDIGAVGLALSLGFASGAMLYVVFGEILPQAILMYHSKLPAFSAIVGILVGMLIIFA